MEKTEMLKEIAVLAVWLAFAAMSVIGTVALFAQAVAVQGRGF